MSVPSNPTVSTAADIAAQSLPLDIELPDGSRVGIAQPGKLYPAGTAIAVWWFGGPPVSDNVLLDRARVHGEAWRVAGFPGAGTVLAAEATGAEVINTLTAGDWEGTCPILVPPDQIAVGKLLASGEGAAWSLVDSGKGLLDGLAGAAQTAGAVGRALPWILGLGCALIVGVIVYKVVK